MNRDSSIGTGLTVMALIRAIESYRPERDRLFDDRFSRGLLPGSWRAFLLPGVRHALLALGERRGPGALGNLYCRTRYIDDALVEAMRGGISRVVILGAGFDARPYRIPDIEGTQVYELDLPAPQKLKRARLKKILGETPAHVAFVPIDFDRQELKDVLAAAGFREGAETFLIWEGVTQYITAEAVDGTFEFATTSAAEGSKIVFTYIHRGIVDGTACSEEDQKLVTAARRGGMPWIFGLDPPRVGEYLSERGLTLVEEVWAPDYRERYLEPRNRSMSLFEGERVVLARVEARG